MKYFLFLIGKNSKIPVIDDELWNYALNKLKMRYEHSECLQNCIEILDNFYKINKTKYKTDLEEFIFETNYYDYVNCGQNTIFVSTIHKSKGREFDNVYILLNNYIFNDDESRRAVYVGMTRAKQNLYIHYNGNEFDEYKDLANDFVYDKTQSEEPQEMIMQLSYKDVFLDYFKNKKNIIKNLTSGQSLIVADDSLCVMVDGEERKIVRFSQSCIGFINNLRAKGYTPVEAEIRFIVAWKGENDTEDTMVILPNLKLRKT